MIYLKGCRELNQPDKQTARALLAFAFHQGAAHAGDLLIEYRLQSSITDIVWDNEDQEILVAIETARGNAVQKEKGNSSINKATSRTDSEKQ